MNPSPPPKPPSKPAAKPARAQPYRKAKPLTPEQRAAAVLQPVHDALKKGNAEAAEKALAQAKQTASNDPNLPLTDADFEQLQQTINTLPAAAKQVLKYAVFSPFSALGIERLAQARTLNTVNKRTLLKNYRKLALQLHPDKCDHPTANDAMQALNVAYDSITVPPKSKFQPAAGAKRPRPQARR